MKGEEQRADGKWEKLLEKAANGNGAALNFLRGWSAYCHAVDDLVDDEPGALEPDNILKVMAMGMVIWNDGFYAANRAALLAVAWGVLNDYADSVAWEQSVVTWQMMFRQSNRHAGLQMALAVANLCGGFMHMRGLSAEAKEICWADHHDAEGKAV